MQDFTIEPYQERHRIQILQIWENAVLATHHFLSDSDFVEIKAMVSTIDFSEFNVFCVTQNGSVLGFIGVEESKIEMLFVDPLYFGIGLGKRLLTFAISELQADKLDVNEQNEPAVQFYLKFGFTIYEKTKLDDQGRNYPLIRMKWSKA